MLSYIWHTTVLFKNETVYHMLQRPERNVGTCPSVKISNTLMINCIFKKKKKPGDREE